MTNYYYIIESCMRPSGAYAKTLKSFKDEESARKAFATAFYSGPEYGIQRGKQIALCYKDGVASRKVLATRNID
jgi:hypothetical protein